MESICPWAGFMSFSPLYAQIELAWAGAPVRTPDPENGTPGVPGGPVTSPARAPLAVASASTATEAAIESSRFITDHPLP